MKLEPDMYVRTKDGDMFILDKIEDNHLIPRYVHIPYIITEEDVLKTSYSIIDLIEVGDVITFKNDEDVYRVSCVPNEESACDCFYLVFNYAIQYGLEDIEVSKEIMQNTLESVITREQFEKIAYKVGD